MELYGIYFQFKSKLIRDEFTKPICITRLQESAVGASRPQLIRGISHIDMV